MTNRHIEQRKLIQNCGLEGLLYHIYNPFYNLILSIQYLMAIKIDQYNIAYT